MKYFMQQKCPICEGHGNVPGGFYNALPGCPWSSTTVSEPCRNCTGSGVVYNICEDVVSKQESELDEDKNEMVI